MERTPCGGAPRRRLDAAPGAPGPGKSKSWGVSGAAKMNTCWLLRALAWRRARRGGMSQAASSRRGRVCGGLVLVKRSLGSSGQASGCEMQDAPFDLVEAVDAFPESPLARREDIEGPRWLKSTVTTWRSIVE